LINSSSDNPNELHSETIEFKSNSPSIEPPQQPLEHVDDISRDIDLLKTALNLPVEAHSQSEVTAIVGTTGTMSGCETDAAVKHCQWNENPATIESSDEDLDVTAELDALLASLQLATPQPPIVATDWDDNFISDILAKISTTETVTDTQELVKELNAARQQLTIACTELQFLHQRNQVQVDRIDANTMQVKQLNFCTQQLAQHSKERVETAREMLVSLEQIRTEIVTNLDKFGGYQQISGMLVQLEAARNASVVAHERVTTEQEAFYDSLQAIHTQLAARSHESEQKLYRYRELIQNLYQTISTDRFRFAGMSVDLSTKLNDLNVLNAQTTTMHEQIVEKSQNIQSKIARIEQAFVELSQSVQSEKEQFYALTVETIEKADAIGVQLLQVVQKSNSDRVKISEIEADIATMRQHASQEVERQLTNYKLHGRELISLSNEFQTDRKKQLATLRKLSTWLWILSVAVGIILLLSIRTLIIIK
jgi:predicted  nucleic acid-binding Zn-ribbon protein